MKDPFLDKNFLKQIDEQNLRTIFIKIIALDFEENPIEEIQGRITQGSITVNGQSAVRRTCSLTMIADKSSNDNFDLTQYYWGLNQKIKIDIGLMNNIDNSYPDIIWIPQGTFIISQFNTSINLNSYTISLQGKDKMCLLNGDVGGIVTALSHDFAKEDYIQSDGSVIQRDLLIKDIIKEVVHEYAHEPYHNIIISDLEDVGLKYLRYRGNTPLYVLFSEDTENSMISMNGNKTVTRDNGASVKLSNIGDDELYQRTTVDISEKELGGKTPAYFSDGNKKNLRVTKYVNGDIVGYQLTNLTYAGEELIGQVGNPITSACLDKIVKMLGDYEYFYNVYGQFIFQRKKTYINTSFNNIISSNTSDFIAVGKISKNDFDKNKDKYYILNNENFLKDIDTSLDLFQKDIYSLYSTEFIKASSMDYNSSAIYYKRNSIPEAFANTGVETSSTIYSFENSALITSFQNNPQLEKIKNDFSIWGERSSKDTSSKFPIHLRYAIDKKPTSYTTYKGVVYKSKEIDKNNGYDWRELIYQMAQDNLQYGHKDDFLSTVREKNEPLYPTGYTGYEQYYIDIVSFWRQLYYPGYKGNFNITSCSKTDFKNNSNKYYIRTNCKTKTFDSSKEYYYIDASKNYVKKEGLTADFFNSHKENYYIFSNPSSYDSKQTYYEKITNEYDNKTHWNKNIRETPELINFWFDFLDNTGDLSQYSCKLIGNRPKAINDTNVKAIYLREVPTLIFHNLSNEQELIEQKQLKPGYTFVKISNDKEKLFDFGSLGKSAKSALEEILYEEAFCQESITFTALPVYYLEPNTRIFVRDDNSNINGEYIISQISYNNIGYNGTMNITAKKAIERIF